MSVVTPPPAEQAPTRRPAAPSPSQRPQPVRFDALLGPARTAVRVGGMVAKEITEIVRQPVLMLTLILGPFLVLLLFGLGSTGQQPPVRVILVVPNDGTFSTDRGAYKDAFSSAVQLVDNPTTDQNAALA